MKNPFSKLTEVEKEVSLDKKFVEEYNKLVKKYKRTLTAALQVVKVKEQENDKPSR